MSSHENKELITFIDNFSIKDEEKIEEGENLTLMNTKILLEKVEKSICEIIRDKGYGTGFFCKIKDPNTFNEINCLITNYHVITKDMLKYKKNIEIKLNNKDIKLSLNLYRRIWINEEIDFTCIEILNEDNIIEIINTFEVDHNCYNLNYNVEEYDKAGIVISSIGIKKEIEIAIGSIQYIQNELYAHLFFHNCNTKPGFSGGPIILINNLKIIGMHKGYEKNYKMNIGIYFKEILKNINEESEIYGKNIIDCIIDIKLEENEKIIFNQNKNNKEEIKDNVNVFLENKRINIINEENKWKIDNKFEKDGKYNLKIIFKNNLKNMNCFFENCSILYSIDLSNFNTSKVNDMGFMFNGCYKLKEIKGIKGINNFNTNEVINMTAMFQLCKELEYLDISNFNTSKVKGMEGMFSECYKLKEIKGIEKFNTNKVTNMNTMFQECKELKSLDLSNFNTSKVNGMEGMFSGCYKLKEIKGINKFTTNEVTNMRAMFNLCKDLEYLDLSNFNTSKVNGMEGMFSECYKLKEIKGIDNFNTNEVTNMSSMFNLCKELENLDLSNFNTSKVNDMKGMFNKCYKLKEIKGINEFTTNEVTNMKAMFNLCKELQYLDLSYFNTSKVTDMGNMFSGCYKLKEIKGIENFNIIKVTNLKAIFNLCKELEYLDLSHFNTSKVNHMESMFSECYKLKKIKGIESFNTNKVTNMSSMFNLCKELEYLDLSHFNTSKVNDMEGMFNKCYKLKEIKGIDKFITNEVTNMNSMFQECKELEYLELNFNTSKVNLMESMFSECYKLKEIKGIESFNTNEVTSMKKMFKLCKELEYLDLSNFNTLKVNDMEYMFSECYKLKNLNLINFSLKNDCLTNNIFECINLNDCKCVANDTNLKNLFSRNSFNIL